LPCSCVVYLLDLDFLSSYLHHVKKLQLTLHAKSTKIIHHILLKIESLRVRETEYKNHTPVLYAHYSRTKPVFTDKKISTLYIKYEKKHESYFINKYIYKEINFFLLTYMHTCITYFQRHQQKKEEKKEWWIWQNKKSGSLTQRSPSIRKNINWINKHTWVLLTTTRHEKCTYEFY
jgi:hypothetical protein